MSANHGQGPQLDELDDHTLLAVFRHLDPLPDLFNVAQACRVSILA